tara:strand:- start:1421 stop:1885 length:465 start_codon:yes stop_codon:yes gene_type:complete
MYKLVILLFLFGCQSSIGDIKPLVVNYNEVSINVVEKELVTNTDIPNKMNTLLTNWFNDKVKVNGFQGKVLFEISQYQEIISNIENGKKIDVKLQLNIQIDTKDQLSNQQSYQIKLNEFGIITGSFSLSEVDTMTENLQKNIVSNLSKTINSRI